MDRERAKKRAQVNGKKFLWHFLAWINFRWKFWSYKKSTSIFHVVHFGDFARRNLLKIIRSVANSRLWEMSIKYSGHPTATATFAYISIASPSAFCCIAQRMFENVFGIQCWSVVSLQSWLFCTKFEWITINSSMDVYWHRYIRLNKYLLLIFPA